MIVKVVMLYPTPTDVDAFEDAYLHEHIPHVLATIPGLSGYTLSKVLWTYDAPCVEGDPPYFLMAELYFPSLEALQRNFTPAVAETIRSHAAAISTGGVPLVFVCMEEAVKRGDGSGLREVDSVDAVNADREEVQQCYA